MKTLKPFQLTKGDVEIITHAYKHRLITIDHISALTGREPKRINERLYRLSERKYLYRRQPPLAKYIYTVDRASVPILTERGVAPNEELNLQVRNLREMSELFLKHALMLTDIRVALVLASRDNPVRLQSWKEGKKLNDRVIFREDGKEQKVPVRPDAFVCLKDVRQPDKPMYYALEADRSTTTHARFKRKIKGYAHYFKQGLHEKRYGIKGFRVLTITLTHARAKNLCHASSEALPKDMRKLCYFTDISSFLKQPFGQTLINTRDYNKGIMYSLTPPLEPDTPTN